MKFMAVDKVVAPMDTDEGELSNGSGNITREPGGNRSNNNRKNQNKKQAKDVKRFGKKKENNDDGDDDDDDDDDGDGDGEGEGEDDDTILISSEATADTEDQDVFQGFNISAHLQAKINKN